MNKAVSKTETDNATPVSGLDLLRKPFEPHQISKLPKPTKRQTDDVKADFKNGIRCDVCGGWHHKDVIHLDYVGHAALTDRLLDADQNWFWEPVAFRDGLPAFDQTGGLWIKLTVCGVTRLGYGHAAAKPNQDPGAREKEVIGDALRNAAMRFGAALDLWHKGDLHGDDDDDKAERKPQPTPQAPVKSASKDEQARAIYTHHEHAIRGAKTLPELAKAWAAMNADKDSIPADWIKTLEGEKDARKAALSKPADDDPFPGDLPSGTVPPNFDDFPQDTRDALDNMRAG
jgi:hypothetical protein